MVEELLVEERIDEGSDIVAMLAKEGFDCGGAFWVKYEEGSPWILFIVCPSLNAGRNGDVYQLLSKVADEMEVMGLRTPISDIKFIDEAAPMASEAVNLARRHPAIDFVTVQNGRLGGRSVATALIYTSKGLNGEWPRISYRVTYHRRGDGNEWSAETAQGRIYRKLRIKGAVSYSTSHWVGEPEGQEKLASVSVLLEIDPAFDSPRMLEMPEVQEMLREQARQLADVRFLEEWPQAKITHEDYQSIRTF